MGHGPEFVLPYSLVNRVVADNIENARNLLGLYYVGLLEGINEDFDHVLNVVVKGSLVNVCLFA